MSRELVVLVVVGQGTDRDRYITEIPTVSTIAQNQHICAYFLGVKARTM